MDRTEFENKLMIQGGDLDRWPATEAEAAKRLLAVDAKSRDLLTEALAVDRAVHQATGIPLETALVGRIMAAAKASNKPLTPRGYWRQAIPAGALVVALAASMGFKTGYEGGFGRAEDLNLVAVITGDAYSLEVLP
ncbi:hypothetical protein [Pleomorphomonas sp. JP5]|uniref:hypothetical protein n=1 Tax=Pleomorphomonas sp. JP5 TaxID=2942998 RepID=UPI002044B9D5|nr:hypothetical protein [Pleomorphomonas sp. JP5]MCM5556214.1 hypothetical protein [Pleomorphomonas sp. JP5]